MLKLNFKIALRNLWKNKGITIINIGGLAVALAAFILVMIYADYETTYDKENPNYERIYMVGRTLPEFNTNFTPPPLGKAIKANFPEVEAIGMTKKGGFEFPISNKEHTAFTSKYLIMDYEAAKMFNLKPEGGLVKPEGDQKWAFFVNQETIKTLFPGKKDAKPEMVLIGDKNVGVRGEVGVMTSNPHSNITFNALSIRGELGIGEDYGQNNYNTYILVKDGTDINLLEQKINTLYVKELVKAGVEVPADRFKQEKIFLDPLKNLHLQPKAANDSSYKVIVALSILAVMILVIACINFTNLSIAQATKRAKEVGIKKVLGVYRYQLTLQFLIEILLQCMVAVVLALAVAELVLPKFNSLFNVSLEIWSIQNSLILQLPIILLAITLISGAYPAVVLSGFKPSLVL
ncbi:MAG: FtsX-like permease family protein, partial [Pedobacter sp.]